MKKFESYEDLKKVYDSGKFDIFYENGNTKYRVDNIGSTIYCHHMTKNIGMGAVFNFPIEKFYAIEKPIIPEIKDEVLLQQE